MFVDVSTDILTQLERAGLAPVVDAVVLTHHHADHMLGLHDLCCLRTPADAPLAVYAGPVTTERILGAFGDLLRPGRARIELRAWHAGTRIDFGDVTFTGFETHHREVEPTTAVLLEGEHEGRGVRVAYATDMGPVPPTPRAVLEDVDLFCGDGTYLAEAGYGHPASAETIAFARGLGARRIALTHVGHWQVAEAEARRRLPEDVAICRDGDDLLSFLG